MIIKGAELDVATGVLTLEEPAINLVRAEVATGERVYEEAVVGATICVAGPRIGFDTGANGEAAFSGVAADMTQQLVNDSYGRVRLTSFGAGMGAEYGATLVLEDLGATWVWETPEVLRDDRVALRAFAEATLREGNRISRSATVQVPWLVTAPLGAQLRFEGPRPPLGDMRVRAASWDLRVASQGTTIQGQTTRGRGSVRLGQGVVG
jgi:hypothetical protein